MELSSSSSEGEGPDPDDLAASLAVLESLGMNVDSLRAEAPLPADSRPSDAGELGRNADLDDDDQYNQAVLESLRGQGLDGHADRSLGSEGDAEDLAVLATLARYDDPNARTEGDADDQSNEAVLASLGLNVRQTYTPWLARDTLRRAASNVHRDAAESGSDDSPC